MSNLATVLKEHTIHAAPALVQHLGDQTLQCVACANRCVIRDGKAGICCVRMNCDGVLHVPGGYVAGLQVDPIEKKPFFHVYPGCGALSFGMFGCNFHCPFCQNWISSQVLQDPASMGRPQPVQPDDLVQIARDAGARVIVSTYNEPLITSDWAALIFERAREAGIICGYVSNGHATPEVLDFLRPFMSLYKVDLKCFTDQAYRTLGGRLNVVLDTIVCLKEKAFWVEIVTLVVPGFNDSDNELRQIASFIASVSPDIPWHVTAFHPMYKMTSERATTTTDLARAHAAGKQAGLNYVYAGNLPGRVANGENTYCPSCNTLLIERQGFSVLANHILQGACPKCANSVPGVW